MVGLKTRFHYFCVIPGSVGFWIKRFGLGSDIPDSIEKKNSKENGTKTPVSKLLR